MSVSNVIAARRSAVSPRHGAFASLDFHALATPVITALLADAGIAPDEVGELVLSNALGAGGNPARVAALAAGLPQRIGGLTIDRQCCGGLDALLLADAMIRSGQHSIIVAGGVESYSRRPQRYRTFADGSDPHPYEQAAFTPWPDRDPDMAQAADALALRLGICREQQDEWAIESHHKALSAQRANAQEIVPVGGIKNDSFTRALSHRLCARAQVVCGNVTAANMCVAADGAAFCLVVSDDVAKSLGLPAMKIGAGASLGGDPMQPGAAPIAAIHSALDRAGLGITAVSIAEIMEAFAVQAIACQQGAGLNPQIVNPGGGALARGHPIGASGAILAVRLYHQLQQTGGIGLAAIAAAGGLGSALVAEL